MRKGQASTEYLVILAVVIIIALVVVAVLGGFIDIGRGASGQASKSYWRIADVGIVDWSLSSSSVTLVIRNNQDYKIKINAITLNDGTDNFVASGIIYPGVTKTVTGTMTSDACTAGDSYAYTVKIYYNNTDHDINNKVFVGATDLVGTC